MALFGLVSAFLAVVAADLLGNESTRGFTRSAFVLVVLVEAGVGVRHLESILEMIPI